MPDVVGFLVAEADGGVDVRAIVNIADRSRLWKDHRMKGSRSHVVFLLQDGEHACTRVSIEPSDDCPDRPEPSMLGAG